MAFACVTHDVIGRADSVVGNNSVIAVIPPVRDRRDGRRQDHRTPADS